MKVKTAMPGREVNFPMESESEFSTGKLKFYGESENEMFTGK